MIKNDYRRSLIMLRIHQPGYSGHVRLERRTLMGSIFIVINVPSNSGTLCAALVRRDARGAYYAARMGELRRDGRGQATLAYSFDPRNIEGKPLDDYWLIAIVNTDEEDTCDVVLSGNVNGSREVSWNSVRAAACAACANCRPPACKPCPGPCPQPRPTPPVRPTPSLPSIPSRPTPSEPAIPVPLPEEPAIPVPLPEEPAIPVPLPEVPEPSEPSIPVPLPEEPAIPVPLPEVPEPSEPSIPVPLPEKPMPSETPEQGAENPVDSISPSTPTFPDFVIPSEETALNQDPADDLPPGSGEQAVSAMASAVRSAAEEMGIDANVPWPGVSEQVRTLFASRPAKELMLGDGYTYVEAPMPEDAGYDHVDVGIKVEDGVPASISYALPSHYTPELPPGLEGYLWQGGASSGWWTLQTDARTGEPLG